MYVCMNFILIYWILRSARQTYVGFLLGLCVVDLNIVCISDMVLLLWVLAQSLPRQWFDKEHRPGAQNDLTTLQGLVVSIRDCLRIKSGGLLHAGHPCNGFLGLVLVASESNMPPTCSVATTTNTTSAAAHAYNKQLVTVSWRQIHLRFIFMSSGTHYRHLCYMGHPGGLDSIYYCSHIPQACADSCYVFGAWTQHNYIDCSWCCELRPSTGAGFQSADSSIQPNTADMHFYQRVLHGSLAAKRVWGGHDIHRLKRYIYCCWPLCICGTCSHVNRSNL